MQLHTQVSTPPGSFRAPFEGSKLTQGRSVSLASPVFTLVVARAWSRPADAGLHVDASLYSGGRKRSQRAG